VGASITPALELGLAAFVIAFTGAMMPGPLLTVAIEHTVRRGGLSAMLLLVGHALLEALLLLGLAFGLNKILLLPAVTAGLSLVGGAFLVWMGAGMLTDIARGRMRLSLDSAQGPTSRLGPGAPRRGREPCEPVLGDLVGDHRPEARLRCDPHRPSGDRDLLRGT
jgi:threonine/homoserine/homoserine lactone efflux protein